MFDISASQAHVVKRPVIQAREFVALTGDEKPVEKLFEAFCAKAGVAACDAISGHVRSFQKLIECRFIIKLLDVYDAL
uniref:hypothetical protein n=1 Tax=Shimia sp. SK013 TaxID=1389006 RepID=UPI00315B1D48